MNRLLKVKIVFASRFSIIIIATTIVCVLASYGFPGGCGGDEPYKTDNVQEDQKYSTGEGSDLNILTLDINQNKAEDDNYQCLNIKKNIMMVSCSKNKIKYLPEPEDLYKSISQASKPLIESGIQSASIDSSCDESVTLKKHPRYSDMRDLNYLSSWFNEQKNDGKKHATEYNDFTHLVTLWNYKLFPKEGSLKAANIKSLKVQLIDSAGNCYEQNVGLCDEGYNLYFKTKIVDAKLKITVIKKDLSEEKFSKGPFTVGNGWYVRPEKKVGTYGKGGGKSYMNAFNGLVDYSTNLNKIEPGDTIFITGLHIPDLNIAAKYHNYEQNYNLIKSGESVQKQIVIRGDYPINKGIIWNAARIPQTVKWKKYENGVYYINLQDAYLDQHFDIDGNYIDKYFFENIGKKGKLNHHALARANTISDLLSYPGSYYLDGEKLKKQNESAEKLLYVHASDGLSPRDIYVNGYGYKLWGYIDYFEGDSLTNLNNVTITNIFLFSENMPDKIRLSSVRWDGVKLAYGLDWPGLINIYYGNSKIDIVNSTLSCAKNGIYFLNNSGFQNDGSIGYGINDITKDYVIKNNYIHDIGIRKINKNPDSHPVAVQGASNGYVEDNIFIDNGSGPFLWVRPDSPEVEPESPVGEKNIFRRNLIKIGHFKDSNDYGIPVGKSEATGQGLVMTTDMTNIPVGDNGGNEIRDNIVENCYIGLVTDFIKSKKHPEKSAVTADGNVIYNCYYGVVSSRIDDPCDNSEIQTISGIDLTFTNNALRINSIILDYKSKCPEPSEKYKKAPTDYFINFNGNFFSSTLLTEKYFFIFRPEPNWTPSTVNATSLTLEKWQVLSLQKAEISCESCIFDPDSKIISEEEIFKKLDDKYNELEIPEEFKTKTTLENE